MQQKYKLLMVTKDYFKKLQSEVLIWFLCLIMGFDDYFIVDV